VNTPGADLHKEPHTKTAILSDGGVYDNLGLETITSATRRCSLATPNAPEQIRKASKISVFDLVNRVYHLQYRKRRMFCRQLGIST
jgi:hypothetical protein